MLMTSYFVTAPYTNTILKNNYKFVSTKFTFELMKMALNSQKIKLYAVLSTMQTSS